MLSRNILFIIGLQLLKTILGFLFFVLSVRFYNPAIIGDIQFVISYITIFGFILNLGFSLAHLKIFPEEDDKSACLGALLTYKAIMILISLPIYYFIITISNFNVILLPIVIVFLFQYIIQCFNDALGNILMADDQIVKKNFTILLSQILQILLLMFFYFVFKPSGIILAIIHFSATLSNTFFLLFYFRGYKIKKPSIILLKKYFDFTYPLILSNVIQIIASNIDMILIKIWLSPEDIAFYYVGENLLLIVQFIPNILQIVLITIFSKDRFENGVLRVYKMIKTISKYLCMITGALLILALLFSKIFIVFLFGSIYLSSVIIFNIFMLREIIVVNDVAVLTDLKSRGLTRVSSLIIILGDLYHIVLKVIFIAPMFLNLGITGLALTSIIKHVTFTPIMRFFLWKKFKYDYYFGIIKFFLAAIISYFICSLLIIDINLLKVFILIPIIAILSLIIYISLLYIMREIGREDYLFFRRILKLKELTQTFLDEISVKKDDN